MSPTIRERAERARGAARRLARLDAGAKDAALHALARHLRASAEPIAEANRRDLEAGQAAGLSVAVLDRLQMGPAVVEATAAAVEVVARLPDPVGSQREGRRLANGLLVARERVPLGVIAMIYEARPNVTIDAAALCLKAGNAVLLRGGKEASQTNSVLGEVLAASLGEVGLPVFAAQVVPAGDRESTRELLGLTGLVDLAIPRGGEGLVRFVAEHARVPVVQHYHGVCHLYLDAGCDVEMARALVLNGKVQRPGVCNALECLLVHEDAAREALASIAASLAEHGVEIRGCPRTRELVPAAVAATGADWGREFLDLVLAVRVVPSLEAAIEHIERHGSHHTEAICTRDVERAERFLREVDASCVLVNASTRFNDGGQLGLGAEIGISTSKLHAYGPMGLESLTCERFVVRGSGQVRR
ncbi:MAG: glutamate-5-semialdehyde dehydrogenase [Polyangiaceae bacterium]|nr:glutamate-5-semialdehyde dehydrogenase [Polyangiaceae bacterium]